MKKQIVIRDFIHQNITYGFRWAKGRHTIIMRSKSESSRILWKFLNGINRGNFPQKLFNDITIKRISGFRLEKLDRGVVPEIGKRLIRLGLIYETKEGILTSLANDVFELFKGTLKPSHEHILKHILREDDKSIATEIPIWTKSPESITGHIDLLRNEGDIIQVVDYKPEGNFMRSIPQVAYYGFLMKKKFQQNIQCISFNKNMEWSYDPVLVLNAIDKILKEISQKTMFDWQFFI